MTRNLLKMFGTLVESAKKGKNLVFVGNRYYKNGNDVGKSITYWRCVKRTTCNGTVQTVYLHPSHTSNKLEVLKIGNRHTHEADEVERQVETVMRGLKRRAKENPNEQPLKLLRSELEKVENEEVLLKLPERQSVIKTIQRQQGQTRPKIPPTLEALQVVHPYNVTLSNEKFLQFDSGETDSNRILMFYTQAHLKQLCSSRVIFGDGTFKVCPKPFYQLYTFHTEVFGHVFPAVYALTMRKDEATYNTMLTHLKQHASEMNWNFSPSYFMLDFEMAAFNAVKRVLPNSIAKGCLFHYDQSVWRQASSTYGLKVPFNENKEVRDTIHKLMALPFIKVEDVVETFLNIGDNLPESEGVEGLWDYIDVNYVRGRPKRGRREAIPPRFNIEAWNVHVSVLENVHRTNNHVESFHAKFLKMIVTHHSSIWKFIEHVKQDEHDNKNLILQLQGGHKQIKYPIKKSQLKNSEVIKQIVSKYDEYKERGEIDAYLLAISYRLKRYNTDLGEAGHEESE